MEKVKINLGPTQTTLLIPLLGRASETLRKDGLINDTKAVEIVEAVEYDFDKWKKSSSLIGASVRTLMIDEDVTSFLETYPSATIVEIGCGLNTRLERLDNGLIHWFDLDLPDTIELRRKFFTDSDRRKMLVSSVLDQEWMGIVKNSPGPYLFISEAVIIYLENNLAKQAITQIASAFPNSWFITDTTSSEMVDSQSKHDAMKYLTSESWFKWKCNDPKELERWGIGLNLLRSRTFLEANESMKKSLPLTYKIIFNNNLIIRLLFFLLRKKISDYRINFYHINGEVNCEEI